MKELILYATINAVLIGCWLVCVWGPLFGRLPWQLQRFCFMFLDYLHILVTFLLFRVQLFHSFLHNSCWQTQVYQVYNASIFSPYLCKYCIICLSLCCLFLVLSVTIVINIFFLTILVGNTFAGHGKCIFPGRLETLSA